MLNTLFTVKRGKYTGSSFVWVSQSEQLSEVESGEVNKAHVMWIV